MLCRVNPRSVEGGGLEGSKVTDKVMFINPGIEDNMGFPRRTWEDCLIMKTGQYHLIKGKLNNKVQRLNKVNICLVTWYYSAKASVELQKISCRKREASWLHKSNGTDCTMLCSKCFSGSVFSTAECKIILDSIESSLPSS